MIFTDKDASHLTVPWGQFVRLYSAFFSIEPLRKCECIVGLTGRLQMPLPSEATAFHLLAYPSHIKGRKLERKAEKTKVEGKQRGQGREAGLVEGPHPTLD